MRVKVFPWLGQEFVSLSWEGNGEGTVENEIQEVYGRFTDWLDRFGLTLDHTVRTRQFCRDFDSWAICDTTCFHLFDRTPYAWGRVAAWSRRRGEFQKRGAFALVDSLALHDRETGDAPFLRALTLIEREGTDGRNFVKKAVNWALRSVGNRNRALHAAPVAVAKRLAARR